MKKIFDARYVFRLQIGLQKAGKKKAHPLGKLICIGAADALPAAVMLDLAGASGTIWALPLVLFAPMIVCHGVRQGRSICLVDMAPKDRRVGYTAVLNSVIGIVLLG